MRPPAALQQPRSLALAAVLGIALLALLALALSIGPVRIDFGALLGGTLDQQQSTALWLLRLPRAVLAILAGAALGLSGALMQTYFRNPLAEPYITGISAGGALGAVLGETVGLAAMLSPLLSGLFGAELASRLGPELAHSGAALAGAALITAALYAFALRGRSPGATATLLLGIALGTFCGAVVWFLLLLQGPGGAQSAMAWLLGRVSTIGWWDVLALLPALLLGSALALFYSRDLDALLLGDEKAASLGVNLSAARRGILAASTLLAAACVAVCGVIAFVGLMVPHVVRSLSGGLHRRLLPLSALGGAVLLLFTDIASRMVHPPGEVPLTVLTSLIGAPFFIWILLRRRPAEVLTICLLGGLLLSAVPARAQDEIDLDSLDEDAVEVTLTADSAQVELGQANVEGSFTPRELAGSAAALTLIRREELAGSASLAEVLERVPGLDVRSDGGFGQLSVAQLRGSRAQQLLVLLDGQPLSPGQVSDLSTIPAGMLERVEVLRGPQAARYGSGALGGVINLVSSGAQSGKAKAPARKKGCECTDCSRLQTLALSAGSHGLARVDIALQSREESWYFSHQQARNNFSFERGGGDSALRRNNDARQAVLHGRWRSGETQWSGGLRLLRRGVPGAAEFPTLQASLARESLWLQAGQRGWRQELHFEHSRFSDPQPYLGQSIEQEDSRLSAALNLGRMAQADEEWGLRPRLDYVDSRSYGRHARAGLDASWAFASRPRRGWSYELELGALASSDSGIDPALRAGARWQIDMQNSLYASTGYSVRLPDFSELYLSGGGSVQGNPELQPERLWSAELGAEMSFPDARLSAAAFYSAYRDSILFLPVSSYLVRASNTGPATVAGAEALLDWQIRAPGRSASLPLTRRECWLRSSYTWLPLAEFESGTPLSARAEHHLNARLEYSILDGANPAGPGERSFGRGWHWALDYDYSSGMPADLFGSLVIRPRSLFGAELRRSLGRCELELDLRNIFDVNTRDSWNYPLPGREYYITLRSEL
ncbi:TonB-dependent receptor [bacterium]|nr:TonB-dependent receptor [bacterium]